MTNPVFVQGLSEFKTKSTKNVAVLIKEFNRKKSAFQYSRATVSSTGCINVNKLHAFKYDDNIFKSITQLADAQNHGMLFFIDYSGSMRNTISSVIRQTMQLVMFCKAVGIPFAVYGFSGNGNGCTYNKDAQPGISLSFDGTKIFELVNSSLKKADYEQTMREFYATAWYMDNNTEYGDTFCFRSIIESFGATPLYQMLIVGHQLAVDFRKKHNVQKMNITVLSDGEGGALTFAHGATPKNAIAEQKTKSKRSVQICGNQVEWFNYDNPSLYRNLICSLRKVAGCTVIGYFIADRPSDYKKQSILSIACRGETRQTWRDATVVFDKMRAASRKTKVLHIKDGFGYDDFFVFDGWKSLSNTDSDLSFSEWDDSSDVGNDFSSASSQTRLAKTFTKFSEEKKTAMFFLMKFAEIVS